MNIQTITGVVIDKSGFLSTHALLENMNEETLYLTLYHKGKINSWTCICVWEEFEDKDIYLYGFLEGQHNQINQWNQFEPLGSDLYYGDLIFVAKSTITGLLVPINTRTVRGLEEWANAEEDINSESQSESIGEYDYNDGFLIEDVIEEDNDVEMTDLVN